MTYRERREARAERLREYAAKRESGAAAIHRSQEPYRGDHAYNFQPANPNSSLARLRRRENARTERAFESESKAREMASRAETIDRQAERAIYSDDPDAPERLRERIAELEAEREEKKARNRAFRKEHAGELKAMSAYQRSQAVPHPSYELQNLGGNIGRQKARLAQLEREQTHGPRDRLISARYAGECADCGAPIERGQLIRFNRTNGARCAECPTREEAPCAAD